MSKEVKQGQLEKELDEIPKWVMQPPADDAIGFYGVGTSKSSDYAMALSKATMKAEFALAKRYQQELSGSERLYQQEDVDGNLAEQTTLLIDKLVADASIVGYDTVERDIKAIDGKYHAFVLLKLPYDQFNRVLKERKTAAQSDQIKAAFDELQARLEAKREKEAGGEQASLVADPLEVTAPVQSNATASSGGAGTALKQAAKAITEAS